MAAEVKKDGNMNWSCLKGKSTEDRRKRLKTATDEGERAPLKQKEEVNQVVR